MDAILIREAGGLGDILQIGSAAPLLRTLGYNTHLYTLADPAILELANMVRGIDVVHPLRIAIADRRVRGDKSYHKFPYLSAPLAHATLTDARTSWNRLYDMFCPAWLIERDDAKQGKPPRLSRAQAFVEAVGFDPAETKPAKLLVPDNEVVLEVSERLKSKCWTFLCLWSKDPARTLPKAVSDALVRMTVDRYGPTVAFHYPQDECHMVSSNLFRYPGNLKKKPTRASAISDIISLMSSAVRVVTVDTFALHVAGSLGKPTVLLCGPTFPEVVSAHYSKMRHWKPKVPPECYGCYYQQVRGFGSECREKGCKVLATVDTSDVRELMNEAGEACVHT